MQKVLAILSAGILLFGCQGPKVKEAVDSLKVDADSISAQIAEARLILTTAADLEKEVAKRLSDEEKEELLTKVDDAQKSIVPITALKAKIAAIKDSLLVLEGKATGKTVEEITALRANLDDLLTGIAEFDEASAALTAIKSKLEGKLEEKPVKKTIAPPAPKPEKKAPPPRKK